MSSFFANPAVKEVIRILVVMAVSFLGLKLGIDFGGITLEGKTNDGTPVVITAVK